ncbi:MAG: sensor histidine kinase [Rhodococcus sp.]|nr:sensor histidine kinase [Rhodococcus sp. (in: high G+C Gram-positive bacteria)]
MPIVGALASWPFVLIRANPALGWALSAAAALVIPRVFDHVEGSGYEYPWQVVHIIVMMCLLAAVAVRSAIPVVIVAWLGTVALFYTDTPGEDGAGWVVGLTALVLFCLLIRWLVLARRQLARQEEENELERARRTILEERARIARDLHDVVAHHMSMVVVQAQSAPYRLGGVSGDVQAEFDAIGVSGRAALNEIRGMLGVLRSDGQLAEHAPQPGIDQVQELFETTRRAGIALSVTITGELSSVATTTGLVVYRILQEALANAARHAPGAPIAVTVSALNVVSIAVVNGPPPRSMRDAHQPGHPELSGGHGIIGMRERAHAIGGTFTAGPEESGGFSVRVELPGGAGDGGPALIGHDGSELTP